MVLCKGDEGGPLTKALLKFLYTCCSSQLTQIVLYEA